METKDKKAYEISFLAKGEEAAGAVITHLNEAGAEITNEEQIEKLDLAYDIDKHSSAHFGAVHFNLDPDKIRGLRDALKFEEGLLRYIVVTPPIAKDDMTQPRRPKMERREESPEKKVAAPEGTLSNQDLEAKLEEISGSLEE